MESVIQTDVLLTIAEVAIAILGFAAIVTALRARSDKRTDLVTKNRIIVMIEGSSIALAFSFLPFVFRPAQLADATTAAASSGLFAVATVILGGRIFSRQRTYFGGVLLPETRFFDIATIAVSVALAGGLAARTFGLFPQLGFAPYIACLLFFLFVATQAFVRLVFFASENAE